MTADNFFSSYDLVSKLYAVNFRFVGTLKKNKPEIPACFLPQKIRATNSSIFGFLNEKTLVSYVPKANKAVVLISSEHHNNSVNQSNNSKPDIILFYNQTKGSVDAFDQKTEKYTCRRKTNRWPFTVFMYMLDSAAINSVVLFNLKYPDVTGQRLRRKLLEELSCNLILDCAVQRYIESSLRNHIGFNKNIMMSFHRLIKVDKPEPESTSITSKQKKRCCHSDCKGNGNKYIKKCQECDLIYCNDHCEVVSTIICKTCILD